MLLNGRRNLKCFKPCKNISKKQGAFATICWIMKKTHKNLAEIELENLINKMVDKMIIEYCQHKNLIPFQILLTTLSWLSKRRQDTVL